MQQIQDIPVPAAILVLDTSVILRDDHLLQVLGIYDLAIPARVLEELDPFKEGQDFINHTARAFIRKLDDISGHHTLEQWLPLGRYGHGHIKVITTEEHTEHDATEAYEEGGSDNYILNAALYIKSKEEGRPVVLVSNDINLRLKAKALGVKAMEYHPRDFHKEIQAVLQG